MYNWNQLDCFTNVVRGHCARLCVDAGLIRSLPLGIRLHNRYNIELESFHHIYISNGKFRCYKKYSEDVNRWGRLWYFRERSMTFPYPMVSFDAIKKDIMKMIITEEGLGYFREERLHILVLIGVISLFGGWEGS